MTRARIQELGEVEFDDPATEEALAECEDQLGHRLPAALRAILGESDGVRDEDGFDIVWPTARIGQDNAEFRANRDFAARYMSFDDLVFFSDSGDGDRYAISLRGPGHIYEWDHEDDSRTWVAADLVGFAKAWLEGEMDDLDDDELDEDDDFDEEPDDDELDDDLDPFDDDDDEDE